MKLRTCFHGLEPGDVCTGTIMRFALQSARLVRAGVVKEDRGDFIFLGFKKNK